MDMDEGTRVRRTRRSFFVQRNQYGDLVEWEEDSTPAPQLSSQPRYQDSTTSIIVTNPSGYALQQNAWEMPQQQQYPQQYPAYLSPQQQYPYMRPQPQYNSYTAYPVTREEPRPRAPPQNYNPFADHTAKEVEPEDWRATSPGLDSLSTLSITDDYSDFADSANEESYEKPTITDLSPRSVQTAQDQKAKGRRQRRKEKKKAAAKNKKQKNAKKKKSSKENNNMRRSAPQESTLPPGDEYGYAQRGGSHHRHRRMSAKLTKTWSSANVLERKSDSSKIDRYTSHDLQHHQQQADADPERYSAVVVKQRRLSTIFRRSSRKLDTDFGDLGLKGGD